MSQSLLENLPQEILDQIILYLLGDRKIHIVQKWNYTQHDGRHKDYLGYELCNRHNDHDKGATDSKTAFDKALRCSAQEHKQQTLKLYEFTCALCERQGGSWEPGIFNCRTIYTFGSPPPSIFLACKRLYSSVSRAVYWTNTFKFESLLHLDPFVSAIGRFHSANLRSIHLTIEVSSLEEDPSRLDQIDLWDDFEISEHTLSNLKGLQVLSVLCYHLPDLWSTPRSLIDGLIGFKQLKLREVHVMLRARETYVIHKPWSHFEEFEQALGEIISGEGNAAELDNEVSVAETWKGS